MNIFWYFTMGRKGFEDIYLSGEVTELWIWFNDAYFHNSDNDEEINGHADIWKTGNGGKG